MLLLLYCCSLFEFGCCYCYCSLFELAVLFKLLTVLSPDGYSLPPTTYIVQSLIDQDLHKILLFEMTPSQNLKSSIFAPSINIVKIFSFAFILTLTFHNQTKQPLFDFFIIKSALMIESTIRTTTILLHHRHSILVVTPGGSVHFYPLPFHRPHQHLQFTSD